MTLRQKRKWERIRQRAVEGFPARFWSNVKRGAAAECWPWAKTVTRVGYGVANYPGGKKLGAHRVAWELTNGPITGGLWVLHNCDNRRCCNPAHLFLGTASDNTRDMMQKGRRVQVVMLGSDHPNAKLDEARVLEIRDRHSRCDVTMTQLAKEYGVSFSVVQRAVTRRTWRHV